MHFFGGEFLGLHLFRRELLVSGRVYHGVIMCFFFRIIATLHHYHLQFPRKCQAFHGTKPPCFQGHVTEITVMPRWNPGLLSWDCRFWWGEVLPHDEDTMRKKIYLYIYTYIYSESKGNPIPVLVVGSALDWRRRSCNKIAAWWVESTIIIPSWERSHIPPRRGKSSSQLPSNEICDRSQEGIIKNGPLVIDSLA